MRPFGLGVGPLAFLLLKALFHRRSPDLSANRAFLGLGPLPVLERRTGN